MRFASTKGQAPTASLREAVLAGLAPDGGLYHPVALPRFTATEAEALRGQGLATVLDRVGSRLFDELDDDTRDRILAGALDFPVPLVPLGDRMFVLELTHGPTLAFKDVGARVLARLLTQYAGDTAAPLTVLTATSGDTGGAVAHAFHGLPGVRVEVLYPAGQVSPLQERQFAALGGNVRAWAVRGTFDDCQRLVKSALSDAELQAAHRLTSANSINVGRLLPQVLYYAHGWAQLPLEVEEVVTCVPSGNVGNLTAGAMAKRLGVPLDLLVAATNVNDVLPAYLRTGRYEPRASVATISSAMDVGDPSNVDRLVALYDGNLTALRRDVVGSARSDDETRRVIRRVHERHGYVMDPHTAVGFAALERVLAERPRAVGMLLATAHPAKFAEIVEPEIGTRVEVPERLRALLDRSPSSVPLEPEFAAFRAALGT